MCAHNVTRDSWTSLFINSMEGLGWLQPHRLRSQSGYSQRDLVTIN